MKSLNSLESIGLLQLGDQRRLDVGRQALRPGDAAPGADRIVDAERLVQRRHVLELRVALVRHDRERLGLAGVEHGARLRHRAGDDVDAAGREILHGGRRAVRGRPGDMVRLQAHRLQPADQGQMPDAALAGAGGLELAFRRGLDRIGQRLDVLVGRIAPSPARPADLRSSAPAGCSSSG